MPRVTPTSFQSHRRATKNVHGFPDTSEITLRSHGFVGLVSAKIGGSFSPQWPPSNQITPIYINYGYEDYNNWFSDETGRFEPKVEGYYQINVIVGLGSQFNTPLDSKHSVRLYLQGPAEASVHSTDITNYVLQTMVVPGGSPRLLVLSGSMLVRSYAKPHYFQAAIHHDYPDGAKVFVDDMHTRFQAHLVAAMWADELRAAQDGAEENT